jgi:hypothetical protein
MTHEGLEPLLRAVSTQAGEEKLTERRSVNCSQYGIFSACVLNTRDVHFRVSEGVGLGWVGWFSTVLLKADSRLSREAGLS